MNDISSDPLSETAVPPMSQVPRALVFLARFFGTAVQAESLRDGAAIEPSGHAAAEEGIRRWLAHAGLTGTWLRCDLPRPTELPALFLGSQGECIVVLALRDGQAECHQPGIEGVRMHDVEHGAS